MPKPAISVAPTEMHLRLCLDSCKELLCVRIMGGGKVRENLENLYFNLLAYLLVCFSRTYDPMSDHYWAFDTWRNRFEKRKLALRISDLQRAISAHIEKRNALLILYVYMIERLRFVAADLPMTQVSSASKPRIPNLH